MKTFWGVVVGLMVAAVGGMFWATYSLSKPETKTVQQIQGPVPTEYCWNKVVEVEGEPPYWPSPCHTVETRDDVGCAQVIVPLKEDQILEYQGWKQVGKPSLIGC